MILKFCYSKTLIFKVLLKSTAVPLKYQNPIAIARRDFSNL